MAPPDGAGRGWCSGCRGGAQSVAVTSAMAALAEAWSTRFLPAPAAAVRGAGQVLMRAPGLARGAGLIWVIAAWENRAGLPARCWRGWGMRPRAASAGEP